MNQSQTVTRNRPRVVAIPGRVNRFIAVLSRKLPQGLTQSVAPAGLKATQW
jgi:hypothetical protein